MNTKINKGFHGWVAETSVQLDDGHALQFTTMKRSSGGVSTTVTRVKPTEYGYSFVAFQDFNMRVLSEPLRATEKAVADQHQRALALLDEIKAACDEHYSAV